jgi:hypothetical protein
LRAAALFGSTTLNFAETKTKIGRRFANAILQTAGSSSLYSAPGHFYSPIVNPKEAIEYVSGLADRAISDETYPHVDQSRMNDMFSKLASHFPSIKYLFSASNETRYKDSNSFFNLGDVYIYSAFISELKPKLIVEVGSGYSSACALDTADRLKLSTKFVFIEPNPNRLYSLLSNDDRKRTNVFETAVQKLNLTLFDELGEGDILFLDTTHICKTGSDVNHELFYILPRLNPGVIVHFHDIFDTWEYPAVWIDAQNRSWNEIYVLRAFLMYNPKFEIVYFNDLMWKQHKPTVNRTLLGELQDPGSGLYLMKK